MEFEVSDIDHVAIRVTDVDDALAFYHGLLGLPTRDEDAFAAGDLPFATVVAGGLHLHLFPTEDAIETGNDHVCLLVRCDDTDTRDAADRLIGELEAAGYPAHAGEPEARLGAYGRGKSPDSGLTGHASARALADAHFCQMNTDAARRERPWTLSRIAVEALDHLSITIRSAATDDYAAAERRLIDQHAHDLWNIR